MTLTELRYIVALAREQHFGRAAAECFVSQPTLSAGVKKLEKELGIELFERTRNAVRVSDMGQRIIQQARKVLEEADAVKELAKEGKDQLSTPLRVGAIYTIGPYLFPHLVPKLAELASDMPLYIEENFTAVLRRKLRQGELDAIIIALPFTEPDVLTLPIYDEAFRILMPGHHPWAEREAINKDELSRDEVLLLGEGHCFRDQILEACPVLGVHDGDDGSGVEATSLETIRHMVASGMGISILPESALGNNYYAPDVLTSKPFSTPRPERTVALAWRASFPRPKAIDVLAAALKQCTDINRIED
ncbi:LysR family transcriptional regulator [Endozoicomonas montiporae]|uniref:LysR family transcriptional regulator n=2 Tax=Endozoicomonas montiporae TaxID=1027273 RepID=A0A081N0K2_9GAMM|nr:hydrogen peroxide-inducible genes activator [Endozoicomonas montiporae]AMO54437.1 oxidative stress regulatory protein OxyR [Endozoicomonas montiporae CL-33]KEQ11975.1 LysR family transcriptional regulator [Endozoicomonas montiporae]